MPISIYPPTLKSTLPAFLSSTSVYQIYFTLQSITSFSDIGHAQVRIVRLSNNRSIVDTSRYPDGTIYKAPSAIGSNGSEYYVSISSDELIEKWQPGYLYKVLMRFGTNAMFTSVSNFATWKQEQIDLSAFSEWSTVIVIKAIAEPSVNIKNAEAVRQDVVSTERTEATLTPLFTGTYSISAASKEAEDIYKFDLYEGSEVDDLYLLETSGWLQHNSVADSVDEYRFKTVLTNDEHYTVIYTIKTVNGYEKSASAYNFLATRTYLSSLTGVTLKVEDDTAYCRDNGVINLYCTATSEFSGNYVITRTDEKSNYTVWEDLAYLVYSKVLLNNTLIYQDFTVESGIRYKYAILQENAAGLRTSPVYDSTNASHMVDFEYSYLYHNGVLLRLSLSLTLSSFKHTTLRTKQDTLGDRFPHLVLNGLAYYAEFPISGMISFQMDEDLTFFTLGSDGYYYQGELVIPKDKFAESGLLRAVCARNTNTTGLPSATVSSNDLRIDSNCTGDNIFVERIFREKAEEFLNDFDYKLYRSPTEGNIVVGLLNVSLTPNSTLGRMIFNFSATAYEVVENTIENLNEFGIIDIGEFTSLSSDEVNLSFGLISGVYGSNVDIYSLIREQEEISIGGGYKMSLKRVISLWVEQYPDINFTAELLELNARKSEALTNEEDTSEIDKWIKEYEGLAEALSGPLSVTSILSVNGSRVIVAPNKVYSLNEGVSSLNLISASAPIIVNYVCELTLVEDTSVGVISAIDASRIWGQISGVFSGTDSVLKTYNYNYKNSETYRIYNNNPDGTVKTITYKVQGEDYTHTLVDNTEFNVYKTINIFDIIKQEVLKLVELIYGTKFEEVDGELTDGTIYYEFNELVTFDIEADEGTLLYIGKSADGSDRVPIKIGPTGRYVLNPLDEMVQYIALAQPQFCVINYKCLTNLMKMTKIGG